MSASTHRDWAAHASRTLQDAGHRNARGRRAVVELLASQRCALTAREIDDTLRAGGQSIGLATVYRSLELLERLKLLTRLDVGQGVSRYEPLQPGGEHHHHLVCDSCGVITPFDDPQLERAIERVTRGVRFNVAEHDVVLHGECETCR
ncbi:MAG: Fur family transcriptional regulator, ferric uptake regulator [Solirubrobacteraceae bacterium]|jgi:Fur family ferric uptake transcriptional regulator|nr:Fur family transcriptional regulator, ferric uptake regulator [Solirubrobacteraceae bacterium]